MINSRNQFQKRFFPQWILVFFAVLASINLAQAYYTQGTARVGERDYELLGWSPIRSDAFYFDIKTNKPLFFVDFGPFNVSERSKEFQGQTVPVVRVYDLYGLNPTDSLIRSSQTAMGNGNSSTAEGATPSSHSHGGGNNTGGGTGTDFGIDIGGGYVYTGPPSSTVVDSMNRLAKDNYASPDYGKTIANLGKLANGVAEAQSQTQKQSEFIESQKNALTELSHENQFLEECVEKWLQVRAETKAMVPFAEVSPDCDAVYKKAFARLKTNQATVGLGSTPSQRAYQPDKGQSDYFEQLSHYAYQSQYRSELDSIRSRSLRNKAYDLTHYRAQQESLRALIEADNAYLDHDTNSGDFFKKSAIVLADLATDILPITGFFKDFYRAWTGYDVLSGEQLSPTERAVAGVFAVANLATFGGSGVVRAPVAALARMAKTTYKDIRVAEEVLHAAKATATNIHVLRPGTSGKYVLLGQKMQRVHDVGAAIKRAAEVLGKENIVVHTFEESGEARLAFDKLAEHNGGRLSDALLKVTQTFQENKAWIVEMLQRDHTIIALDDIQHHSVFFEMELEEIAKYLRSIKN